MFRGPETLKIVISDLELGWEASVPVTNAPLLSCVKHRSAPLAVRRVSSGLGTTGPRSGPFRKIWRRHFSKRLQNKGRLSDEDLLSTGLE